MFHNEKLFEKFDIVSSTESGSIIPFNYYVHYMTADGMPEAIAKFFKPHLDMKVTTALASYTASHKGTNYNRQKIAAELMRHFPVAAFGKSLGNNPVLPKGCHNQHFDPVSLACIMSHHKFHFAFENSQVVSLLAPALPVDLPAPSFPVDLHAPPSPWACMPIALTYL